MFQTLATWAVGLALYIANNLMVVQRSAQRGFARVSTLIATLLASVGLMSLNAYAALPASVATTVTGIQTDMEDLFDIVFPVVAIALGLVVVIKLFKRFGNKI